MEFLPSTATPIRPLLDQLEFIVDPQRWGYKFRFGLFSVSDHDMALIARAMGASLDALGWSDAPTADVRLCMAA